jgi:hypothetical protein
VLTEDGVFEQHRTHLVGVGYRITGSLADRSGAVGNSGGAVTAFTIRDGRVAGVYQVLNPERLVRLPRA